MNLKLLDQIFSRWVLDGEFRSLMNNNPELALAGYNLSEAERKKLAHLSRKTRRQTRIKKGAAKPGPQKYRITFAMIRYTLPVSDVSNFSLN